jgi:glycosyltransferase involved in cell wall biosynthesis
MRFPLMSRRLRIAQVAPPFERVPPQAYGGTERIVHGLVAELEQRGHEVTTFASGDSVVPGRHIATVPLALRPLGYTGDSLPYMQLTMQLLLARVDEFDLVHSHLEWISLLLARVSPVPVVSTFHGRLDLPWADDLLADPPAGLVAISESQASTHPDVPWAGVVHNGLRLADAPFGQKRTEALCFVGRVAQEKGIVEAIEVAKAAGRPLKIAAKVGPAGPEKEYNDAVFQPALAEAGDDVEFLGELSQADRDQLLAESYAALMPGSWPEPFGLVAIEALACGTPIIARRSGALPEIIRDGVDGFFGDDVTAMAFKVDRIDDLDRKAIRESVIDRFSVERMTDSYEAIYRTMLAPEGVISPPVAVMSETATDDAQTDAGRPVEAAGARTVDPMGVTAPS